MGLKEENLEHKKCYDFNSDGKKCENCAMERAMDTNVIVTDTIKKQTKNGDKYFYVFAVPIISDNKKYVIEILIDRTEEFYLRQQHEKDLSMLVKVLSSLLAFQNRDGHETDFVAMAVSIGKKMDLSEEEIDQIEIASNLCDIGMISMGADGIELSANEMHKTHPIKSKDILNNLSGFDTIKNIILHHHENFDGSGHPYGLAGKEIPLGARILGLADVLLEKGAVNAENLGWEVKEYLKTLAGSILDPDLVDIVCRGQ